MYDDDAYREAFDIHGTDVECITCGAAMDELSVQHWRAVYNLHGEFEGNYPLCDRCFWEDYEECARDAENPDNDWEYWED